MKDELTDEKGKTDLDELIEKPKPEKKSTYSKDNLNQLNEKLEKAVLDEDDELPAKIRDEINKRSSK